MLGTTTRSSRKALVGLLAATAMLITACGSQSGETGSDGDGGEDGDAAEGIEQFPGELADSEPQTGGRMIYALEAATADGWCLPESQLAISGIQVARAVYDTLTIPDANGEAQPHLAESVEPNDDHTEWSITLREGITFHDGSELDAEVVKNNIDAYRGSYEGRDSLLLAFTLEDIANVRVEDEMTVVVETAQPWVSFDSFLFISGRMGIMAQSQLDADGESCSRELVGTGPFEFESWNADDSIELSRNGDYWREDAHGNQLPYLDELEFQVIPEGQQRANALLSGQIDAFHMSSNTNAQRFWDMADEAEQGNVNFVHSDEFAEVGFMMLNTAQPPFDNITARQAMAHAIDREAIAQDISDGLITSASGPFSEGSLGYLEDAGYPEYDPEEARSLVEQYEQETGEPLEITITSTPESSLLQLVELTSDYLDEAGIEVDTNTFEQSQLIQNAISGEYQAMTFRNYPDLDPDNLYVWWYGGSPVNFMGFDDPEINDLLDRGRTTADPEERQEIYEELNRELSRELPMLWASWTHWGVAAGTDAYGFHGSRPANAPDGSEDYTGFALGQDPAYFWKAQEG